MATEPGRNAPCPCGSGRKYKQCCLTEVDAIEQSRVRVRRAEGRVVDALFSFALKRFGKPFFEHAWLDFWADEPPDADEFTDIPEFESMFIPWFVTGFVRDPHAEDVAPDWPDEPLGLYWLRTERRPIDDLERKWLTAVCASPMSVFVVEHVDAGRSLDIRDVFTGRRFHALEQSASRTVRPTDLLFVRVVTAGGICLMFGMAPLSVPGHRHLDILDWRDRVFKRRVPTRSELMDYDLEIRDLYLELANSLRNPVLPQLQNTDGDPLELTTLTYDLTTPVAEAFERLRPLATLGEEQHVSDMESDAAGTMTSVILSWVKAGNRKNKSWDNTILGTLRIATGRLIAEANSKKRADRLAREIARRLGPLAVLRTRSVEDVDRLLKDRRTNRAAGARGPAQSQSERPAEFDAIEDDMYCRHLEGWVDTRIPALGHRTPRQLARTARGRQRIEALIGSFEGSQVAARPARREAWLELRRTLGLDASAT